MAAGNNSNALFYNVSNGKIVRQFQSATEHSKTRVNKNGKTVHEEFYDYLDGKIVSIDTKENEYGKFWVILLEDDGVIQNLQFNYSGGYAAAFLKTLPNVDLSKKVKLIPKTTTEGDKTKATMFINQDGKACKWFYTKDEPNGLPQLKKIKIKGKEQWDDSEVMEFLEEMVKVDILPQLEGSKKSAEPVAVDESEDEKLPF